MSGEGSITWLQDKAGNSTIAQNNFYSGEAWGHKSAMGMGQEKFPKAGMKDEGWWLRNCDSNEGKEGCSMYYNSNPLQHKAFGADALAVMDPHHSRKVFLQLARQGHSFSHENVKTLQQDVEARRHMAQNYCKLMRHSASTPAMLLDCSGAGSPSSSAPASPSRPSSRPERPARDISLAPAGAADAAVLAAADVSTEDRKPRSRAPKPGSLAACPKAELRSMANGRRIVVLPNPRLQVDRVPHDVHQTRPPIFARASRVSSLDHNGEMIFV